MFTIPRVKYNQEKRTLSAILGQENGDEDSGFLSSPLDYPSPALRVAASNRPMARGIPGTLNFLSAMEFYRDHPRSHQLISGNIKDR